MLVPFLIVQPHFEQAEGNLAVIIRGSFLYVLYIVICCCLADLFWHLARLLV